MLNVEAGLRCYDDDLPEETNRRVTDSLSDYLFTPSVNENKNLKKENITKNVFFVGNIMIDSLKFFLSKNKNNKTKYKNISGIITFHRPENVDDRTRLIKIIKEIKKWSLESKILFPVHPRTKKNLINFNISKDIENISNLIVCDPLSYNEFLLQVCNASFVITDSGGIQEETSYLGIPCFTIRKSTERPITISRGSNKLIKLEDISNHLYNIKIKKTKISKWDGKTASRIIEIIKKKIL